MTNPSQPGSERRFTIHYGFALLAILSLLGTLIVGIPMIVAAIGADDQNVQGVGTVATLGWLLWGGMWTAIWSAFAINHTLKSRR